VTAVLAVVRPDDWNLPLFVHVGGAMLLVGAMLVAAVFMSAAVRRGDGAAALTRLGFRALLIGVIPAYIVMRVGAQWIAETEDVPEDASWLGFGYGASELGLLLTIIATVLAWRATKKGDAGPGGLGRAAMILTFVVLVLYVVAIWAMTVKPT
jgi:hypothetical protein